MAESFMAESFMAESFMAEFSCKSHANRAPGPAIAVTRCTILARPGMTLASIENFLLQIENFIGRWARATFPELRFRNWNLAFYTDTPFSLPTAKNKLEPSDVEQL